MASSWFTSEIQQMMFGFGDSSRPLLETAALVEEIVHQQMVSMIEQALKVAINRGVKHIGIEDILFLLRKDKVKLKRLLRYYEVRDLKNAIKSTVEASDDGNVSADFCSNVSVQDKHVANSRVMSKSIKICYDFLSAVDQTGELVALFDDTEIDTVKYERMLRAEMQSIGMDTEQYKHFCQARQTNFIHNKMQHFKDWLQINLSPDTVLSAAAIEILSYLAYETVAQIVDLALLVKQDKKAKPGVLPRRTVSQLCVRNIEPCAGNMQGRSEAEAKTTDSQNPPYDSSNTELRNSTAGASSMQISSVVMTPSKHGRKKNGSLKSTVSSWDCTILPADVREAMRRYFTDIGPFASHSKISPHCSTWHRTLCK